MESKYVQEIFKGKSPGRVEQLIQLMQVTWDGDIISKIYRDDLVHHGLACREEGYNFITKLGISHLHNLGIIKP